MARRYDRQFRAARADGTSIPGAQVTLWDSDGVQITTGITDLNGTTISGGILTCDSYGYAPAFIDTADRLDIYAIGSLSGEIPGVDRVHLEPTDTDDRVTALEASVAALSADVETGISEAVQTAGGSIITIGEDDNTTQALIVHLPTGDRTAAGAPDTFAVYVNVGTAEAPTWRRTGYFNEYGLLRVIAIARNQVPLRVKAFDAAQSANLLEVTDIDNNVLGGFAADGTVLGRNLGSARTSAGTSAPTEPRAGDLWSDTGQSPPVLRMFDGTGWLIVATTTVPAPAAAPSFQASSPNFANGYTWVGTRPAAGDSLIACLAWNTVDAVLTPPDGWMLVEEIITTSARSGVWKAAGDVPDLTWAWDTNLPQPKISGVILGYEACTVADSAALPESASDAVHTAPDLNVATVPSTLLRIWWDKASTTTNITLPGGVTQRGQQLGTGGGSCAVIGADASVSTAGNVGTADATFDQSAANAGGYSLALVAV